MYADWQASTPMLANYSFGLSFPRDECEGRGVSMCFTMELDGIFQKIFQKVLFLGIKKMTPFGTKTRRS